MASRQLRLSQIPPPWSWSFGRPSAQLLCEVCSVRSCPQLLQMWANKWIRWVQLDWQLEWQQVDGALYWVARSAGTSALRVAYSHTSPGGTLNSCPVPQKHRIASFDINIINMCNTMILLDNINLEMHYTHKSLILECKMSQETVLQIAKWWETVYRKKQPMNTNWLIACSRRWHGQDKTVSSCPCRWCEHNCRQDKTVLSCLDPKTVLACLDPVSNFQFFSNPQYTWEWAVAIWKLGRDETKLSCFVCSFVHTTDTDKTKQSCLVRVDGVNKL